MSLHLLLEPNLFCVTTAYSAYTYEEMAAALKLAFPEIKFVSILNSFANFKDSVDGYLNDASKTPGLLSHNVHFQVPSCTD